MLVAKFKALGVLSKRFIDTAPLIRKLEFCECTIERSLLYTIEQDTSLISMSRPTEVISSGKRVKC